MKIKSLIIFLLTLTFFAGTYAAAQPADISMMPDAAVGKGKRLLLVPYPFFNDTIGTGLGVAMIAEGYVQPQMVTVATVLGSTDGTYLGFMMVRNYQVPWLKRLILDPQAAVGKFQDIQSYTKSGAAFPNERAGSNDSDADNYFKADGTDYWFDFIMQYLLPIGHGKTTVFPKINLDHGIFVSGDTGGDVWNPLVSGRTYLEFTPFFRSQDLDDLDQTTQKTVGLNIGLFYDNTNYFNNPSKGSYQRLFYSWDPGKLDSSNKWQVASFEAGKYFSLGPSKNARDRVIALNIWTADCLTWNDTEVDNGQTVFHRPPTYKGANLGGLWRMKGYAATRYHDRAALYYGAEYRYTLKWNPLADLTLGGKMDVSWIQLVGFGEIGRVAPSWDISTLHENMKWTAGGGVRTMVNNIIVRADLGVSDEDAIVQLFIGQPF